MALHEVAAKALAAEMAGPEPAGRPLPTDSDALLHTAEAAYLAGLSPRTFDKLRTTGGGCPYVALGRAVRYRRKDLLAWIDRLGTRRSTSDRGKAA